MIRLNGDVAAMETNAIAYFLVPENAGDQAAMCGPPCIDRMRSEANGWRNSLRIHHLD